MSTLALDRSSTLRSTPPKASSDQSLRAVPGVTRMAGGAPPNVYAYWSRVGVYSTTSMTATYSHRAQPYMVTAQVLHPRHAQQRKRAGELSQEDVGGPLHAMLTAGHQPEEVRPT